MRWQSYRHLNTQRCGTYLLIFPLSLPARPPACLPPCLQVLNEGDEVTLMGWGNCIMRTLHKDAAGAVTAIDAGARGRGGQGWIVAGRHAVPCVAAAASLHSMQLQCRVDAMQCL